eukprot:SAG11_NODE_16350_length_550_cov_0.687361_1_plen_43_part_10
MIEMQTTQQLSKRVRAFFKVRYEEHSGIEKDLVIREVPAYVRQ